MAVTKKTFWAEVHLARLQNNLKKAISLLQPGTRLLGVVKANAYGHGIEEAGKALLLAGAYGLAVGTVDEGMLLREAGVKAPVLLLGYLVPGEEEYVINYRLTPMIANMSMARQLARLTRLKGRRLPFQVRLDTSEGNVGLLPEQAPDFIKKVLQMKELLLEGIFTHLYSSYGNQQEMLSLQLKRFQKALNDITSAGIAVPMVHAASSPALLYYPETHFNAVRPGTVLYGLPSLEGQDMNGFLPVMELKSRVVDVKALPPGNFQGYGYSIKKEKPVRVATISAGYAHGYLLFNLKNGEVLIRGKRAPIYAPPQMEYFMADVTSIPEVVPGDEVVLLGCQGKEEILASEIAHKSGISIIHCESICLLNPSVPRVYFPKKNEQ